MLNKKQWHLTDDPHFKVDPEVKPAWNSLAGDAMGDDRPKGVFVTEQPEYWMQAHGYERPYVAELEGEITNPPGTQMYPSRESFMAPTARTKRVLPIDEYVREQFNDTGWVEEYHEDPPTKIAPGYEGRSTADMSAEEIITHEQRFTEWSKRSR